MKKGIEFAIAALSLLVSLSARAADPAWTVDKAHSRVGFEVSHLGLSSVEGTFSKYEGTVIADAEGKVRSVSAVVQVSSIHTGNDDRDTHLRSAELFNVVKYPEIRMTTKTVNWKGKQLSGKAVLTIKGKTMDVKYRGTLTGKKTLDERGRKVLRVGYAVTTEIDRTAFGIEFGSAAETFGLVGKTVEIQISVEITRPL